ncbi:MAG TPA: polysaccharide deacetylase family protein [Natronoarchaeum rubrum]|nr:polysaccharide deacetylase family protein [Natronoarchaeum rubrum]
MTIAETRVEELTFTFEWYEQFLDALRARGRRFRGYRDDLSAGDVVLRHDVDWSPRSALETARIESERGVSATYFVLTTSPFYNLLHKPNRRILDRIEALGHDVELHFSTHQYWDAEPPERELRERVRSERTVLSELVDGSVDVVSFHRPPEWVFRREFDGFVSAYEERFFTDIAYRADSNQRWRDESPLAGPLPDKMQVLTHPGLWGVEDAGFAERLRSHEERTLGRTRRFMEDQFIEKKYNIDDFCPVDAR